MSTSRSQIVTCPFALFFLGKLKSYKRAFIETTEIIKFYMFRLNSDREYEPFRVKCTYLIKRSITSINNDKEFLGLRLYKILQLN